MRAFEFGMKFKVGAENVNLKDLVERLYEAGCDDAVAGTGEPGLIALNFTREAPSANDAVVGALSDVKNAIADAELIEVAWPTLDVRRAR